MPQKQTERTYQSSLNLAAIDGLMTIPILDRVIEQLQALEAKFDELMLSLLAGQIPVKLIEAVRIEGAKVGAITPQLKVSQAKFIQIYNEIPILLQAYAMPVDWTIDSYQNPKRLPLLFHTVANSNYWVIPSLITNQSIYWLVPNPLRQIRFDKLEHLSYLFEYPKINQIDRDAEFHLVKPGQVSYYFDAGVAKWKLEQPGQLAVNSGAIATYDPAQPIEALQQQMLGQAATIQHLQQQAVQQAATIEQLQHQISKFTPASAQIPPNPGDKMGEINTDIVAMWRSPKLTKSLTSQQGTIKSIALTRWQGQHHKLIMFASTDSGAIGVWDLDAGKYIYQINRSEEMHTDTPTIASSPDRPVLISTTENHQIKAYHIIEGKEYIYGQHDEWVLALALSGDGSCLATGDRQGTIKIWDTQEKAMLKKIEHHIPIVSMAITPDNRYLITGDNSNRILVWAIDTARLETVKTLGDLVCSIAISPDGKYLALGLQNGNVEIWDAQTYTVKYILPKMHQQVWSLAFDSRSQILASGGTNINLCLWDVNEGTLISQPTHHQKSIYALTFSPDGQILVTAGLDGAIDLWVQ
jgi:WD40 repeat protein